MMTAAVNPIVPCNSPPPYECHAKSPTLFREDPGFGALAEVNGKRVLVGNRGFLDQNKIDTGRWEERAEAWRADAKTVVFFAIDGLAAGIAAVADPIKESTAEAISTLKTAGIRVVMLTGDSRSTADAVARQLGIDETLAEVLPEDKAGHVTQKSPNKATNFCL